MQLNRHTIYDLLARLPTVTVGQAADLKVDTGRVRVWLSRCTVEDGETRPIQLERFDDGKWSDWDVSTDVAEDLARFYAKV